MTKGSNDFKRLVRARMARTGESYTTAKREMEALRSTEKKRPDLTDVQLLTQVTRRFGLEHQFIRSDDGLVTIILTEEEFGLSFVFDSNDKFEESYVSMEEKE